MENGPVAAAPDVQLSSIDKVQELLTGAGRFEATDEEDARLLQMFQAVGPIVATRVIPDDPAELDRMLLSLARWAIELRSDGAWRPVTIEEMFNGPEPELGPEGEHDDADQNPAPAA